MSKSSTSVSDGVQKPKRAVPKGLTPFTPLNAKQAQEASVRSRNLRKQMRAKILEHLVTHVDLGVEVEKAIKTGDLERMNLLQTAFKMVGLHADQADERNKSMTVSATTATDSEGGDNGSQNIKLEFEIVEPAKEED